MATSLFQSKLPPHGSAGWFYNMVDAARLGDRPLTEYVELSPPLAAELLRNNPDNRSVRPMKLRQLVKDIQDGRWVFNGEPILVAQDGSLNDGQHRASAVIEANASIPVLMVFGLDRASRTTVDQGAARGAADYMAMKGIKNPNIVAAVGRLLISYENGDGRFLSRGSEISSGEILHRFSNDTHVANSAHFAEQMYRYSRKYAPPAVIGFCHAVLSRVSPADADTYMRQVCVGESIRKSDPAFAVREGLLRERLSPGEKVHLIFRGWSAFRRGRKLDLAKLGGNLPAVV